MTGPEFDDVTRDLKALAEADAALSAPPRVEQAMIAAFRERRPAPRVIAIRPQRRFWAMAAAAAVVVFAAVRISTVEPAPVQPVPAEPTEVATEFYPLIPGFDPDEAGNQPAVRVEMPRTVLASFGLPVDVERIDVPVKADLVIGETGMAQAIRFVSTGD